MQIDWMTWGIWLLGAILLLTWLVKTVGEFKGIIAGQRRQGEKGGSAEQNDGA